MLKERQSSCEKKDIVDIPRGLITAMVGSLREFSAGRNPTALWLKVLLVCLLSLGTPSVVRAQGVEPPKQETVVCEYKGIWGKYDVCSSPGAFDEKGRVCSSWCVDPAHGFNGTPLVQCVPPVGGVYVIRGTCYPGTSSEAERTESSSTPEAQTPSGAVPVATEVPPPPNQPPAQTEQKPPVQQLGAESESGSGGVNNGQGRGKKEREDIERLFVPETLGACLGGALVLFPGLLLWWLRHFTLGKAESGGSSSNDYLGALERQARERDREIARLRATISDDQPPPAVRKTTARFLNISEEHIVTGTGEPAEYPVGYAGDGNRPPVDPKRVIRGAEVKRRGGVYEVRDGHGGSMVVGIDGKIIQESVGGVAGERLTYIDPDFMGEGPQHSRRVHAIQSRRK